MLLSTTAIRTASRTSLTVIPLLDVFRKVGAHILHNLTREVLLFPLRGNQLLIECILFLSDSIDTVEVVHVADGARAATCHFEVEVGLLHDGGVHYLLAHVPPVVARTIHFDLRLQCFLTAVGAAPTVERLLLLRALIVVEIGSRGGRVLLLLTA